MTEPLDWSCSKLVEEILSYQAADGAFLSDVCTDGLITDENCFVTALVLLELAMVLPCVDPAGAGHRGELNAAAQRALNFIEACCDPDIDGAFRFYPQTLESPRLHYDFLPADIDDTVLAWAVLILFGRRSPEAALSMLECLVESRLVVSRGPSDEAWVGSGVCRTWLVPHPDDDPVDLCVNLNVAALYALCGQSKAPFISAAAEMLRQSLAGAAVDNPDMGRLALYYAHPLEVVYSLRRALMFGAEGLAESLEKLELLNWAQEDEMTSWSRIRPICGEASGRPVWLAPALQAARELTSRVSRRDHSGNGEKR